MDAELARELLTLLHRAQGDFYSGGPAQPLRELLTDDIRWSVPGDNAIAGTYSGIDAVMAYFHRRRELASATMEMHPGELLVGDGDHAAVLTDGTATIGGEERKWSTVGLYRFSGNRIRSCHLLPIDPEDFDRIWGALARPTSEDREPPPGRGRS